MPKSAKSAKTKVKSPAATLEQPPVAEPVPGKPAPTPKATAPKVSDDELPARIVEQHAKFGVPPSFRDANKARLAGLLTGTNASALTYDESTRNAPFMRQWMLWCCGEYRKLAR